MLNKSTYTSLTVNLTIINVLKFLQNIPIKKRIIVFYFKNTRYDMISHLPTFLSLLYNVYE